MADEKGDGSRDRWRMMEGEEGEEGKSIGSLILEEGVANGQW
jgi:hypothetical protein